VPASSARACRRKGSYSAERPRIRKLGVFCESEQASLHYTMSRTTVVSISSVLIRPNRWTAAAAAAAAAIPRAPVRKEQSPRDPPKNTLKVRLGVTPPQNFSRRLWKARRDLLRISLAICGKRGLQEHETCDCAYWTSGIIICTTTAIDECTCSLI